MGFISCVDFEIIFIFWRYLFGFFVLLFLQMQQQPTCSCRSVNPYICVFMYLLCNNENIGEGNVRWQLYRTSMPSCIDSWRISFPPCHYLQSCTWLLKAFPKPANPKAPNPNTWFLCNYVNLFNSFLWLISNFSWWIHTQNGNCWVMGNFLLIGAENSQSCGFPCLHTILVQEVYLMPKPSGCSPGHCLAASTGAMLSSSSCFVLSIGVPAWPLLLEV